MPTNEQVKGKTRTVNGYEYCRVGNTYYRRKGSNDWVNITASASPEFLQKNNLSGLPDAGSSTPKKLTTTVTLPTVKPKPKQPVAPKPAQQQTKPKVQQPLPKPAAKPALDQTTAKPTTQQTTPKPTPKPALKATTSTLTQLPQAKQLKKVGTIEDWIAGNIAPDGTIVGHEYHDPNAPFTLSENADELLTKNMGSGINKYVTPEVVKNLGKSFIGSALSSSMPLVGTIYNTINGADLVSNLTNKGRIDNAKGVMNDYLTEFSQNRELLKKEMPGLTDREYDELVASTMGALMSESSVGGSLGSVRATIKTIGGETAYRLKNAYEAARNAEENKWQAAKLGYNNIISRGETSIRLLNYKTDDELNLLQQQLNDPKTSAEDKQSIKETIALNKLYRALNITPEGMNDDRSMMARATMMSMYNKMHNEHSGAFGRATKFQIEDADGIHDLTEQLANALLYNLGGNSYKVLNDGTIRFVRKEIKGKDGNMRPWRYANATGSQRAAEFASGVLAERQYTDRPSFLDRTPFTGDEKPKDFKPDPKKDQCAAYANGQINTKLRSGYTVSGNAWNRSNCKTVMSGYLNIGLPAGTDDASILSYHRQAANALKQKGIKLNKTDVYAVNLYVANSTHMQEAFNDPTAKKQGTLGTHTGNAYYDFNTNQWMLSHYINGQHKKEPLSKFIGGNGDIGVVAIQRPNGLQLGGILELIYFYKRGNVIKNNPITSDESRRVYDENKNVVIVPQNLTAELKAGEEYFYYKNKKYYLAGDGKSCVSAGELMRREYNDKVKKGKFGLYVDPEKAGVASVNPIRLKLYVALKRRPDDLLITEGTEYPTYTNTDDDDDDYDAGYTPLEVTVPTEETESAAVTGGSGRAMFDGYDRLHNAMQGLVDLLNDHGVKVRITSGFRGPGEYVGKAREKSWHAKGLAIDVVPTEGSSYEEIQSALTNNEAIRTYMLQNGLGFIDETSKETQKKTGATGAHFHIGPDRWAKSHYSSILKSMPELASTMEEFSELYGKISYNNHAPRTKKTITARGENTRRNAVIKAIMKYGLDRNTATALAVQVGGESSYNPALDSGIGGWVSTYRGDVIDAINSQFGTKYDRTSFKDIPLEHLAWALVNRYYTPHKEKVDAIPDLYGKAEAFAKIGFSPVIFANGSWTDNSKHGLTTLTKGKTYRDTPEDWFRYLTDTGNGAEGITTWDDHLTKRITRSGWDLT